MRVAVILILLMNIIGCAITNQSTIPTPSAVIHGIVIMKEEIENDADWIRYDKDYTELMYTMYGSIGGLISYFIVDPQRKANPYVYYVDSGDNRSYRLIHDYSGFSVGDCVKILKYNDEISMTYGDDCSGIKTSNKSLQPTAGSGG